MFFVVPNGKRNLFRIYGDTAMIWKVVINNTYEVVKAENPAEAIEKAKQRYLGQLKVKPWIIEIKEVIEL